MLHRIVQVDDTCIKNSLRVGEMGQRIKLLQYKHNDPQVWTPRTHIKAVINLQCPYYGEPRKPQGELARLAESVNCGFGKTSLSSELRWSVTEEEG